MAENIITYWVDLIITEQSLRSQNTIDTPIRIEEKAAIIQGGSQSAPSDIGLAYQKHIQANLPLRRIPLNDSRGHQLLICQTGENTKKYYAIPAPDFFSRYSGTCLMLGDKYRDPIPHTLAVGDMLHLGSVGLIVTEIHTGQPENGLTLISRSQLECLLEEELTVFSDFSDDDNSNLATVLLNEKDESGVLRQCYICFDHETTEDNPLISACQCCGDTSTVHLSCVRKWHSIIIDDKSCIVTNANRQNKPSCSVCKSAYKTSFKLENNGKKQKIFHKETNPPYITFIVVTRHDSADHLFNTRFQLSFANELKKTNSAPRLYIGRSAECDMILDYRTVSGWHGFVQFQNNSFIYEDLRSSNGTLIYISTPVELPLNTPRTFRLGRTLATFQLQSSNSNDTIQNDQHQEECQDNLHDPNLEFFHELCKWPQSYTFNLEEDIKNFHRDHLAFKHMRDFNPTFKKQIHGSSNPESSFISRYHDSNGLFLTLKYNQLGGENYLNCNDDIDNDDDDDDDQKEQQEEKEYDYIHSDSSFFIPPSHEPMEIKPEIDDSSEQAILLHDNNEEKTDI